jgi:endo-1,4-beta-mannosidase
MSGRPCFAEELGTLAPIIANEKLSAEYLKTTLANLYIHDCRGMLWWCTFDQLHLKHPPYTWCAVERQLGLFHIDRSMKPVAKTVKEFQEKIAALPFKNLPSMQKEALVVLTSSGEGWASAWGAFLLAKKAGFDVEFCYSSGVLPDKDLYIVPSVATIEGVSYELHLALMEKARNGATVLITYDNAMMAPFDSEIGVESLGREDSEQTVQVELAGEVLDFHLRSRLILDAVDSEVLLRDTDGRIVFTRKQAGKGQVFFCALPLEKECTTHTGKVDKKYFEFYRIAAKEICDARPLRSTDEMVTVTIHPTGDGKVIAAIVNNSSRDVQKPVELHKEWQAVGELPAEIPAREMLFVELKRK